MDVLDNGYVKEVESWGSDERIIEAARMSTDKGFQGWGTPDAPGDEKLLAYLMNNRHDTPFEMAGLVIEVQAPIFVFREWHRHRTQCLAGDTMITLVTPNGTTFKRSIREIFDLKHGGVIDSAPNVHKNGVSKNGTPVNRVARRKNAWRVRVLPNCQSRTLRVLNESTMSFETAQMNDVWESGVKACYKVSAGRFSVTASAEHPFFTSRGWVLTKDLVIGDRIARMGVIPTSARPIPPSLRQGIGVWTSMMRNRLINDDSKCYKCRQGFPKSELELDHVIPVAESLKLALDEDNLKPICSQCHLEKTANEQPSRVGQSQRGVRWERVDELPAFVGEMQTYDIEVCGEHHNYCANDLVVHNSYNELSARYTPLPDLNYMPTVDRCLVVNGANKQANSVGTKEPTHEMALFWLEQLNTLYVQAEDVYRLGLEIGIPKELARLPVPVARYSRMRASANLRNWLAFITLRSAPNAQWEIRQFSDAVGKIVQEKFPRTWELFLSRK